MLQAAVAEAVAALLLQAWGFAHTETRCCLDYRAAVSAAVTASATAAILAAAGMA